MQQVPKKHHASRRSSRWVWLAAAVLAVALAAGLLIYAQQPTETPEEEETTADQTVLLWSLTPEEIAGVSFTLRDDAGFSAVRMEDGTMMLTDGSDRVVDEDTAQELLDTLKSVSAQVLAEEWQEDSEELAAFGLDNPESIVTITLTGGDAYTLRIGDSPSYDKTWQYARMDGDARLLSVSRGTAEALYQPRSSLWRVEQPTIHAQRLDEITLLDAEENITLQWRLDGEITDSDAADRWRMVYPLSYPADTDSLSTLRTAAENLRLGEYLAEGTAENLLRYGFDAPRLTIRLHQAAGTMGTVGTTGSYQTTDWPESTLTMTLGGQENDLVDYVLYEGSIYRCSALLFRTFLNVDAMETLTRYPVLTALGNLSRLTIREGESETVYAISRVEQVQENNELAEDDERETLIETTLTRNGETADYDAFAALYDQLLTVTVSGRLPDGWRSEQEPHTVWVFEDVDGTTHTVALTVYDAMHDAVTVDGTTVFYLIQGGFVLGDGQ